MQVLGVEAGSDLPSLRKAKLSKVLAVHPDKLPQGTPGCEQAFQRVQTVCSNRFSLDNHLSKSLVS